MSDCNNISDRSLFLLTYFDLRLITCYTYVRFNNSDYNFRTVLEDDGESDESTSSGSELQNESQPICEASVYSELLMDAESSKKSDLVNGTDFVTSKISGQDFSMVSMSSLSNTLPVRERRGLSLSVEKLPGLLRVVSEPRSKSLRVKKSSKGESK